MSVTDLAQWKLKCSPHLSGEAVCLACKHGWVAVCPVGAYILTCPECGCDGHMKGQVLHDGAHYTCDCGVQLFRIDTVGVYCIHCGKRHDRREWEG